MYEDLHEFAVRIWTALYLWWRCGPTQVMAPSCLRFLYHTQRPCTGGDSSGRVIGSSQRPLHDNLQHSQQTAIHRTTGGIQTHNPNKRTAADSCLRPGGNWNWLWTAVLEKNEDNGLRLIYVSHAHLQPSKNLSDDSRLVCVTVLIRKHQRRLSRLANMVAATERTEDK